MCREQGVVHNFLLATAMGYLWMWMCHRSADAAVMLVEAGDPRQQDLDLIAVHQRAAAVVHASVAATASAGLISSYSFTGLKLYIILEVHTVLTLWYAEPADPRQQVKHLMSIHQCDPAVVHATVAVATSLGYTSSSPLPSSPISY